ncbi:MAG: asparagine--tRNA ligase [Legionellales bacterium]|nr:asparagine--tRNA ligase [Legionellales bacterium]
MKHSSIKNILFDDHTNKTVSVNGWVKTKRDSKSGISFIDINDGSCFNNLQIVVPNTLVNYQDEIIKITSGCAINAIGKIIESTGRTQKFEMQAESFHIIGNIKNPANYPIQPKKHTLEYLRDVSHLRARTNIISAITRIRHSCSQAIHNYLSQQEFIWIHTPIITSNDCEGAGELFRVSTLDLANLTLKKDGSIDYSKDFFGRETFLTVSGQLNLEAYSQALSKVYTFGPTFRAENSNTSRHLAEFWMVEPEIAFATLPDVIEIAINLFKYIFKTILEERADDLIFIRDFTQQDVIQRAEMVINTEFASMSYTQAINYLSNANESFQFPIDWGLDLQSEHEKYICEKITKKPTVITDYPKNIKSFYMRLNDDNETVAAMDILAPGIGEIIGGSQREERLGFLEERIQQLGLEQESLEWYLDLRRYGTTPHGGFGMGLERLLGYMTGIKNVRDLIPFPRTPGSIKY